MLNLENAVRRGVLWGAFCEFRTSLPRQSERLLFAGIIAPSLSSEYSPKQDR